MEKNALTVLANMKISVRAKELKHHGEELGEGLAAPFAVIGYKGGKWSLRHRGATTPYTVKDPSGRFDVPVPFLDLVILFAAKHNSKVYYEKNYEDGDDGPPDCWSTDGIKPDGAAPTKQNPTCHDCRHNAFGSRLNQNTGARGKACADVRRLAVTNYPDIENAIHGGPMLLRVPPASLGVVAEYGSFLKANGADYGAVVTRFGFDGQVAYPKFTLDPLVALTDAEMAVVLTMENHPLVDRIVQQSVENMVAQPGSEQGANVTSPATKGANGSASPGSMNQTPAVTRSDQPATAPKQAVQQPEPQPAQYTAPARQALPAPAAAPPAPVETVPQETLTPEQVRIRELEAKLAQLQDAKAARRPSKPRTPAVAPSPTAEPAPQHAAETAPEEDGEEANDAVLATINDRLSKVMS